MRRSLANDTAIVEAAAQERIGRRGGKPPKAGPIVFAEIAYRDAAGRLAARRIVHIPEGTR